MLQSSNSFNRNSLSLEDVMYDFLDAISTVYHNSMILKGCMCLKIQLNNPNIIRSTRDLDFHFFTKDDWEDFVSNSCNIATVHSKLNIKYRLTGRRGFDKNPNSDSIKIEGVYHDITYDFKIDMNFVNGSEIYELNNYVTDCDININSIYGILSDKLNVLATRKVCRRVKDLLDVYYVCACKNNMILSEVFGSLQNKDNLRTFINNNGCFILREDSYDELEHAYEKYKIVIGLKPDFNEVYNIVYDFVEPVFSRLFISYSYDCTWSKEELKWMGLN